MKLHRYQKQKTMIYLKKITFVILLTLTQVAYSNTIYVDIDALGANDGSSWADAYTELQTAIDAAIVNDNIWIADGTYYPTEAPTGTQLRDYSFHYDFQLNLYGGFNGSETLLTQRNFTTNITILSGDIGVIGDNIDNCYHVLVTQGITSEAIIDGLIIKDGKGSGTAASGIVYSGATTRRDRGTGMNHMQSNIKIVNCVVEHNNSLGSIDRGGGVYVFNGFLSVQNSIFRHNFGNFGGAIFSEKSSLQINNSIFNNNEGYNHAGAVYWDDGSGDITTISGSTFDSNAATTVGRGGAIRCDGTSAIIPIINNCLFINNYAALRAGAIENNRPLILKNSTMCGNSAIKHAGAIMASANIDLDSCLINHNSISIDQNAGGIYWFTGSSYNITNSTVWNNTKNTSNTSIVSNIVKHQGLAKYTNCNIEGSGGSSAWVNSFGTDIGGNTDSDPMVTLAGCGNSYGIPLPIELINFSATALNNKIVHLNWQTASEINNDYFTIECSTNFSSWKEIAKINSLGNTSSLSSYESIDRYPYIGVSYYRLKQTDFDGQFSYSQIKSVEIENLINSTITIYPNPTSNEVNIIGSAIELEQIKMYNTLGQDVSTSTIIKELNKGVAIIDLTRLTSGMYYIKTKTTANKVYKK